MDTGLGETSSLATKSLFFSTLTRSTSPKMKTTVFAFFGLVATALSAKVDVTTLEGVLAKGEGRVTSAATADKSSGFASGAVDGDGAVLGMAQAGSALAGALSSPYL